MKIREIKIVSYRGIKEYSTKVPPAGILIQGENGQGKSSIVRGIRAALDAQDIGPDAVHLGEQQGLVLVDVDEFRARARVTTAGKGTVTVFDHDDQEVKRPMEFLRKMIGVSALDPLAFYLADATDRRKQLLEAMPVQVTSEELARWTGVLGTGDGEPVYEDIGGHGMVVLERYRKRYYDYRTEANRHQKEAETIAAAARKLARTLEPNLDGAPDLETARAGARAANEALLTLDARATQAQRAREATANTRAKIVELRADADEREVQTRGAPTDEQIAELDAELRAADASVAELEKTLAVARAAAAGASARALAMTNTRNRANKKLEEAKDSTRPRDPARAVDCHDRGARGHRAGARRARAGDGRREG